MCAGTADIQVHISNADKTVKQQELSFIAGFNAKQSAYVLRQFGSFLGK